MHGTIFEEDIPCLHGHTIIEHIRVKFKFILCYTIRTNIDLVNILLTYNSTGVHSNVKIQSYSFYQAWQYDKCSWDKCSQPGVSTNW